MIRKLFAVLALSGAMLWAAPALADEVSASVPATEAAMPVAMASEVAASAAPAA